MSASPEMQLNAAAELPALPLSLTLTPTTPTTANESISSLSVTPNLTPISRRDSCQNLKQQHGESDSGKSSSCSPALLDCSFDSGIGVMDPNQQNDLALQKRIQQCKRILLTLERDKEAYHLLRLRLSKIVNKHAEKKEDEIEVFCNVCCAELNIKDIKSFVTCCTCRKYICRGIKCADWLPKDALWECQLCHSSKESMAQTSSWVAEQISFNQQKIVYPMRARSEVFIPINDFNDSNMQFESVSQVGGISTNISADQKLKIREYVEEIVANLLGGSLDNVSVARLSKSENYLPAVINGHKTDNINHNSNNNISANANNENNILSDISQTRLRKLIETIIAETITTPTLATSVSAVSEIALDHHHQHHHQNEQNILQNGSIKQQRRHRTEHYFEPKIYQDLLATAVLNKIVDHQGNTRHLTDSTLELREHHVDENYNLENQSILSGSSIEPRSDSSYSDPEQELQQSGRVGITSPTLLRAGDAASPFTQLAAERESVLSDYIASHMVPLPDLSTATVSETEEDDYASITSSTMGEGTWEDNWLFKKKRSPLPSSVSASTMSMLVPAPKEDVRAQIGDKTADEISDLSEMGSDTDDSSLDVMRQTLIEPFNDRLLNKQLIGGQNTKLVLDELIECASVTSNTLPGQNETPYTETKNENVRDAVNVTEAVNKTLNPHSIEQTESDSSLLAPPSEFQDLSIPATAAIEARKPLPGSIAERECKKWYNAVDMPNNPYAPEALKRRISGKQERLMDLPNISPSTEQNPISLMDNIQTDIPDEDNTDIKRYSRDYYINDAKQAIQSSSIKPSASPSFDSATASTITASPEDNEVIANGTFKVHNIHNENSQWHLSKPVRRSSSLQYLANRYSPARNHSNNNNNITEPYSDYTIPKNYPTQRPATSASNYHNHIHNFYNDANDDDEGNNEHDHNYDTRSQRSWKSATHMRSLNTLPKRRTLSTLSFNSNVSGISSRSQTKLNGAGANVLSQFEKQLLHKDLKRNSFRAISATTKDFVVNPLFDQDKFFGPDGKPKLSIKIDTADDSGVDSCLNGFSEVDPKASNNSLLF